jgi:transglutaminase-like putative cysteine protease
MPRRSKALLLALLLVALPALADSPVLHEYFEPDPSEDLALAARTSGGSMPAAIETPSGVVAAPDPARQQRGREVAYGGASTQDSEDARYAIDRDTTRPNVVDYDDPFVPAVTPFKRLFAYDRLDADLELTVKDKKLTPLTVDGTVQAGDDQFYGDMFVDLAADTPVRIPSVGPGARVLAAHTVPPTLFSLHRDGADNWFISAPERKRVRLVVQLAISRAVFGSAYPDVPWSAVERHAPPLPEAARTAALEVAAEIGISRSAGPRQVLDQLVAHFRAFAPSEDRPTSNGLALYKELALSRKGVCRHRAYAFVITAHALGLPARLVRNEAHAWVEVFDGGLWHRIDLGGAANRLETEQDASQPQHQPPEDPYAWPEGSESGRDLAGRTRQGDPNGSGDERQGAPDAPPIAPAPLGPARDAAGETPVQDDGRRPRAALALEVESRDIRRGDPLQVSGQVSADGEPCARVRVDFELVASDGRKIPIQSLSADERGRYKGAVIVPLGVDVGDYELSVSTPGDARCGVGRSD